MAWFEQILVILFALKSLQYCVLGFIEIVKINITPTDSKVRKNLRNTENTTTEK